MKFSTTVTGFVAFAGLAAACGSGTVDAPPGSSGDAGTGAAAGSGGSTTGGTAGSSLGGASGTGGSTAGRGGTGGSSAGGSGATGGSSSGASGASSGGTSPGGAGKGGGSPAAGAAGKGGPAGGASNGGSSSGGSSAGASGTGTGGTPGSGTAEPSPGCSATTGATGTAQDRTITVGTRERTYRLSVPADAMAGEALPLVFGLNGVGGDGKGAQSSFRLETNHRGIFVYPDSIFKESSGTVDWDYSSNGYDVEFFDALIAELTQNYCVDMSRIFSVGVSAGGIMSNMLGCFRGDVLRGIAPASAMMWNNTCRGDVAVMVFCGTQDTFNPCDTDAKGETDFWGDRSGCGMETAPSPVADICESFQGCTAPEAPVLICTHSGGHMWPTGGSDMVWSFFMGL